MTHHLKWIISGIIIVVLLVGIAALVARCTSNRRQNTTIIFYNDWAGDFTGQSMGWFQHITQERFGFTTYHLGAAEMEELFQTRRAAGDLGDLIIIGTHRLRESIHDGLLMDITHLVETSMPNYNAFFPGAIARSRELFLTDEIFALPLQVSTQPATTPRLYGQVPLYGAFLRQDAYMAIGAPTIYTIENLLPILAQMQYVMPYTEAGYPTYGFSLFSGPEDNTVLNTAAAFARVYGGMDVFSSTGFIDYENHRLESFLDISGLYIRALKLYFDANQLGILDPASANQGFREVWDKFEQGSVLFSWWSWLGMDSFNTPARAAQGIGYNFIPIRGQRILYDTAINPSGPNHPDLVIAVGASSNYAEAIIDFIDWLASPEGHQTLLAGPEGLTWEMIDGAPYLTQFGLSAGVHTGNFTDIEVPNQWGGGSFSQGAWQGNTTVFTHFGREVNPATGWPFNPMLWPSATGADMPQLHWEWTGRFGSLTPLDFALDNELIFAPPAIDFTRPHDSSEIFMMRYNIRPIVESASWRMIFAGNEAEFFDIWIEMYDEVVELGWYTVFEHDRAVAEAMFAAQ